MATVRALLPLALLLVLAWVPEGLGQQGADGAHLRAPGILDGIVPIAAAASEVLANLANLGYAVSHPGLYPYSNPWYGYGPGLGYYAPGFGYPVPLPYAPIGPFAA